MPGISPLGAFPIGREQYVSLFQSRARSAAATQSTVSMLARMSALSQVRSMGILGGVTRIILTATSRSFAAGRASTAAPFFFIQLGARSRNIVWGAPFLGIPGGGVAFLLTARSRLVLGDSTTGRVLTSLLSRSATRVVERPAHRVTTRLLGDAATRATTTLVGRFNVSLRGRSKSSMREHLVDAIGIAHLASRSTAALRMRVARSGMAALVAQGYTWAKGRVGATQGGRIQMSARVRQAGRSVAGIVSAVIITPVATHSATGAISRVAVKPLALLKTNSRIAHHMRMLPTRHLMMAMTAASRIVGRIQAELDKRAFIVYLRARGRSAMAAMARKTGTAHLTARTRARVGNKAKSLFSYPLRAMSRVGQVGGASFRWFAMLTSTGWSALLGEVQPLYFAPLPNLAIGRYVRNCNGRVRTVYRNLSDQDPCGED